MDSRTSIAPADRTAHIEYAVRDIVVLAQQAAKSGKEMLYLNIGDPNQFDFETPPHIVEATYRAMLANHNGYSPSSGIKAGVVAIEREAHRKGIDNVLDLFVTTGASEAIELCLTALVNPGENVLLPTPGYPLYSAIQSKLEMEENPYYLDESNGWQPNLADITSRINSKTRAIILINPNNPTGSVCDEKTMHGIIDLALKHNLVIFADEIYDKLILDGGHHISIASLNKDVSCITFNGLSKSYLAPGFRIGWGIVSGREPVMRPYIEAINKLLRARLCANHPIQYAIEPALGENQEHLKTVIAKLTRRRDITTERLNAIPGISCVRPEGAFYAFPRLHIEEPDEQWVRQVIRETGVVVVHGSGFGEVPGTRHFRVVFLPTEEVLQKAFDQIERFMETYLKTHALSSKKVGDSALA
jgi:alanine-synthesizing transaminase